MERSFSKEVEALRLGAGETFRGKGILAVTKPRRVRPTRACHCRRIIRRRNRAVTLSIIWLPSC
jgi:hypothetical protein